MKKTQQSLPLLSKVQLRYLLVFVLLLIISGYFLLPKISSKMPQIITRCTSPKVPIKTQEDKKKKEILDPQAITLQDYTFRFPFLDWKTARGGAFQFEEAILFPPTLDSFQFSYPKAQDHGLFLQGENIGLVSASVAPDNCMTAKEWFAKTVYAKTFTTKYQTVAGNEWLIATRKNTLPLHTVVMIHKNGYHYEFNIFMRDEKIAEKYNNILEELLKTFKPL